MALLVELPLNNGERLSTARKLLGLCLIGQEHLIEEAVEVRYPLVGQRVRLCTRSLSSSMTSRLGEADGGSAPEPRADGSLPTYSGSS
jgi:hypothetical protein